MTVEATERSDKKIKTGTEQVKERCRKCSRAESLWTSSMLSRRR